MYANINVCKHSQNKSKHPQQAKGSWKPLKTDDFDTKHSRDSMLDNL